MDRVKKQNLTECWTTIAYEFISKALEVLGTTQLSEEEIDEIPTERQRSFCHDLLKIARVSDPQDLFSPSPTTAERTSSKPS